MCGKSFIRASELPEFKELPAVDGMPHGCAWGLWDQDGIRDNLGSLNLLSPEVVCSARNEIQSGISVALNWELSNVKHPGFKRRPLHHRIFDLSPVHIGHDDELHLNTQSSSQWDGFLHWAHQETATYYNGLEHEDVVRDGASLNNGIHHFSARGGIVGRAVLLDYASWAASKGITFSAITRHAFSHSDLEAVAAWHGVELRPADILIIRSGWIQWYNSASEVERERLTKADSQHVGLNGTPETIEWLWNKHFSAVAGDTIAFEAWPPTPGAGLHDYLLAMFGTPIGELWNLEELAKVCKKLNRWSFFLTSAPLNVVGGVASPPNALAVF
ncbi:hypothetical protein PVAG01_08032 [Phlyctema vagabunda]|uniref:Cyclase n=1 Tax=Phlyctema vagabunda TaxID=108571 RepID=A0ABR4PE32_9HELO